MIIDVTKKLVIMPELVRSWCKLPYINHPHGCPNYNMNDLCPPKIPEINSIFNLDNPHWFSVIEFNLKSHAEKMKNIHPTWTDKQCKCCLYWQNTVRKELKQECKEFIKDKENYSFTLIPEAMGVNVFRTCHKLGIMMRKNPKDILYKVALIAYKKE